MAWRPWWSPRWGPARPSTGLDLGSTWVNLLIAALAAAFALLGRRLLSPLLLHDYYALGVLVGALAGFILHEYAHERAAFRHGCWARFVLHPLGLALTVISALFPIKIVAPGAVSVGCPSWAWGGYNPRAEESISAAGVQVNLLLAIVALVVARLAVTSSAALFAYGFGVINAWVALFNLIPFPPLDGSKLVRVNPAKWLGYFAVAVVVWLLY